jgi:SAM-dependent methyltransferase
MSSEYFADESYEWLYKFERYNFWYRVRNQILFSWINQYLPNGVRFLEIGCGTGFVSSTLKKYYENDCADISLEALKYCRFNDAGHNYFQLNLCDTDFESRINLAQYSGIGLFDVIEHIDDDKSVLKKIHTLMVPGGYLFITVPANQKLWSDWDEFTCHKRRYSMNEFIVLIKDAGFSIERVSYFMFILYPFVRLSRMPSIENFIKTLHFNENIQKSIHETLGKHSILNECFYYLFSIEISLLKYHNLPFGSSIICVAKKK